MGGYVITGKNNPTGNSAKRHVPCVTTPPPLYLNIIIKFDMCSNWQENTWHTCMIPGPWRSSFGNHNFFNFHQLSLGDFFYWSTLSQTKTLIDVDILFCAWRETESTNTFSLPSDFWSATQHRGGGGVSRVLRDTLASETNVVRLLVQPLTWAGLVRESWWPDHCIINISALLIQILLHFSQIV